METYAQQVGYALCGGSNVSDFGLIIDDIKGIASDFKKVKFSLSKRSANRTAHLIVRVIVSITDCGVWVSSSPDFLINILNHDLVD